MLQQQRATIGVHLSVGDPGLPQVITASLRVGVREGERKYTQIQARAQTLHTHTHTHAVYFTRSLLPESGKNNLQCGIMTLQGNNKK